MVFVMRRTSVPSSAITYTSFGLSFDEPRVDAKAISVPSGDHALE